MRTLATIGLVLLSALGAAADEIVIEGGMLRPPVLRTTTAHRVTFVNRTGRLVHIEFTGDPGEHQVFQVPGQIWAVFHRPGRHPYAVHVYGGGLLTTLQGLVEVVDNPEHPWESTTCGVIVMGNCIVP